MLEFLGNFFLSRFGNKGLDRLFGKKGDNLQNITNNYYSSDSDINAFSDRIMIDFKDDQRIQIHGNTIIFKIDQKVWGPVAKQFFLKKEKSFFSALLFFTIPFVIIGIISFVNVGFASGFGFTFVAVIAFLIYKYKYKYRLYKLKNSLERLKHSRTEINVNTGEIRRFYKESLEYKQNIINTRSNILFGLLKRNVISDSELHILALKKVRDEKKLNDDIVLTNFIDSSDMEKIDRLIQMVRKQSAV